MSTTLQRIDFAGQFVNEIIRVFDRRIDFQSIPTKEVDSTALRDSVTGGVSGLERKREDSIHEFEYGTERDQMRLRHWQNGCMLPVEVAVWSNLVSGMSTMSR
jgi:hypothetical protein